MPNKEQEVRTEKYSVGQIPTATEPRIFDGENTYTIEEALTLILNKLDKMEEKIVG